MSGKGKSKGHGSTSLSITGGDVQRLASTKAVKPK